MKSAVRMVVIALLLILPFRESATGQTKKYILHLKPETVVVGPYIYLHEVCEIKPESKSFLKKLKKVRITKAAPPGESKDISLSQLRLVLRHAKLEKFIRQIKGPRVIRVKTGHKDITRMRIEESIGQFFRQRMREFAGDWRLEFRRIPDSTAVPVGPFEMVVQQKRPKPRGYQLVDVQIVQQGVPIKQFTVGLVLHTYESIAVATRRIKPREPLRPGDIEMKMLETTHLSGEPIRQPRADSIWARVVIPKGKIITERMIERIPDVIKGSWVRLEIEAGQIRLETRALAQQSGNRNDWIRVWVKDTRRVLKGQVIGQGKVRVLL